MEKTIDKPKRSGGKKSKEGGSGNTNSPLFWAICSVVLVLIGGAYGFGRNHESVKCERELLKFEKESEQLYAELAECSRVRDSLMGAAVEPAFGNVCDVFIDGHLMPGFDMGVNTYRGRTDWIEVSDGEIKMNYPSGQVWGTVFITAGPPASAASDRETMDFSNYDRVYLELYGKNGAAVEIGLKDRTDPDTGQETKKKLTMNGKWQSFTFDLKDFRTADLKNLYVVMEFVFGNDPQYISARKIQFIRTRGDEE